MRCQHCRREIPDNSTACEFCGNTIQIKSHQAPKNINLDNAPTSRQSSTYDRIQTERYYRQVNALNRNNASIAEGKSKATNCLVLGIISIISSLFTITFLVSIITGIIGIRMSIDAKNLGYDGGDRKAGFVLSVISVIISGCICGLILLGLLSYL